MKPGIFLLLISICNQLMAQEPRLMVSTAHNSEIIDAVVSPDAKYIGTIDRNFSAKLWFAREKILLNTINLDNKPIKSLAFSPVNKTQIFLATPNSLIVYDFAKIVVLFEYHFDFEPYKIIFSTSINTLLIISDPLKPPYKIVNFDLLKLRVTNTWLFNQSYWAALRYPSQIVASNDLRKIFISESIHGSYLLNLSINKDGKETPSDVKIEQRGYVEFSTDSKSFTIKQSVPYGNPTISYAIYDSLQQVSNIIKSNYSFVQGMIDTSRITNKNLLQKYSYYQKLYGRAASDYFLTFDATTGKKVDEFGYNEYTKVTTLENKFRGLISQNFLYENSTKEEELKDFCKKFTVHKILDKPTINLNQSEDILEIFTSSNSLSPRQLILWSNNLNQPVLSFGNDKFGVTEYKFKKNLLFILTPLSLTLWNITERKILVELPRKVNDHYISNLDISDSEKFILFQYEGSFRIIKIDTEMERVTLNLDILNKELPAKHLLYKSFQLGTQLPSFSFQKNHESGRIVQTAKILNDSLIMYEDFSTGMQLYDNNDRLIHNFEYGDYVFSNKKKLIAFLDKDKRFFSIFDIKKREILLKENLDSLNPELKSFYNFYFSADDNAVIFLKGNRIFNLVIKTGKPDKEVYLPKLITNSTCVTLNEQMSFKQAQAVKQGYFLNSENGLIFSNRYECSNNYDINKLMNRGNIFRKRIIKFYSSESGDSLFSLKEDSALYSGELFLYHKKQLFIPYGNIIHNFDASGNKLVEYIGHTNSINGLLLSDRYNQLFTTSNDNTIRRWNTQNGQLLSTSFIIDSIDFFSINNKGYYQCSPGVAKKLYYITKDLKIITFEQLDIKYNRPDRVLESIGCNNLPLIDAYRKAYYKRIRRLGIDTSLFTGRYSFPEADFVNRELIKTEQNNDKLRLHIFASDSVFKLDRFNIWINESPLFGSKGVNIRYKKRLVFDTTIDVQLLEGNNRIETSVLNVNGSQSYYKPLNTRYLPQQPQNTLLHFIGIGINHFADSQNNLSWSVKDVRDLANSFTARYGSTCTIDTLFDEAVTTVNVVALKKKLLQTGVNDKVIVAYSGHGLLSKDYDYYLSTYNVNFSKPEEGGLPYEVLENLLDGIPARKKLMLIDACHSGEVDKEEMLQYQQVQQHLDSTQKGVYLLVNKDAKRLGIKNSFELMQELFVNVGRSTGATIISAAAGTQFALEKSNLQNGVFTYSILEYMKGHPHVTVSELKKYVNQRVPELTQGAQVPTARSETNNVDWEVW